MNKTISALAKSRITYHKSRSILTGLAIALTTALLAGLVTSAIGIFDTNRQQALAEGNHHAVIRHLTAAQIEMLQNHLDVEALETSIQFATISYDHMDGYLTTDSTLKEGIYSRTGALMEGHFPETAEEICAPYAFFRRMDTEPVLGGKLTIPFRVGGEGLIQTREFTICGLVSERDLSGLNISDDRLSYSALVSEALVDQYLAPEERDYTAALRLSEEERFTEEQMEAAVRALCLNIDGDPDNISYNLKYLYTMLSASREMTMAVALIGLFVLFFSALVIYSIYYINVITDVQEIGKLKALGASAKQVKHLLYSESRNLCAVAIPAGLLLGYGIPAVLLPVIMNAIAEKSPFTAPIEHYHMFSLPALFIVTAAVLITVRISLSKPMRMAGKVSPIEAVRYQEHSGSADARKGRRNITLQGLCLANLARNRKRTIVTIVTMGLSCVLFMSLAATINSMNALDYARFAVPEGSFRLYLDCEWNDREYPENNFDTLQQQDLLGESLQKRIRYIDGVTDIGKSGYVLFDMDSSTPFFENHRKYSIAPFTREEVKDLQKHTTQGEIDYDDMLAENGAIWTTFSDWEDTGLSLDEPLALTIHDGDREIPLTVKVCAVVKESRHGYLILPEELWNELGLQADPTCELHISAEEAKYDEVKAALQEIAKENEHFTLYSLDEELQIGKLSVSIVKYPLYGILILVAVIGGMNLLNTMITSVVTRKREFGTLQALGLSDRQLGKMLSLEGAFFIVGTLLISVIVGNAFGYLIFLYAKKEQFIGISAYHYPVWETVFLAAMLICGQLFITAVINRRLRQESLIDRIRSGE